MSDSSALRNLFDAARPLVEESLGLADRFAELRKAASDKGLDWGQIKALLKAVIQDEQDGGERVKKIIEKADLSQAYADMLGLAPKMNKKNFSSGFTPIGDVAVSLTANADGLDIPESLRR